MPKLDRPRRFEGTDAEREENRASHSFYEGDPRCWDCDAERGSTTADYRCGVNPPREIIHLPNHKPDEAAVAISMRKAVEESNKYVPF